MDEDVLLGFGLSGTVIVKEISELRNKIENIERQISKIGVNISSADGGKSSSAAVGCGVSAGTPKSSSLEDRNGDLLEKARKEYKGRRFRDQVFGGGALFFDPAWDILLDLFISNLEGKSISVTSACIASCVPPTTALRWISVMEQEGLISRQSDPSDKRRQFLLLSEAGKDKMARYLSSK